MKRIILKKLLIQNFKGCRERSIDFGNVTNIFGANASGKTTVLDAWMWLLFNKDSSGAEKFKARPQDEDGKPVDNVEIAVEAVLDVDGTEITLRKTQKQNWVKKRGTDITTLQGNVNTYEIDSFPASEKEFKEKISSIILEELFKLLSDPRAFAALPWKKQREILMKFISDVTDADIIAADPDTYAPVSDEILAAGVDKAIEKAKKAMATLKDRQKELPARIDEASKSLVQIPELAELELQRNVLNEQLEEVQKKRDDVGQAYQVVADIRAEIMETRMEMDSIKFEANTKLDARRREARRIHSDLESKVFDLFEKRQKKEGEVKRLQELVEEKEQQRTSLGEKYKSTKAMTMDESETVCKMCGQVLPADRIEQIRADFEKNKEDQVNKVLSDGRKVKSEIDDANSRIKTLQGEIATLKQAWSEATADKNKAYEAMNAIPDSVDISDNQEYQALQTKLSNLETQLGNMDTGESIKQQLSIREKGIREELDAVNKQFGMWESNERTKGNIEILKAKQKEVGQKVADQEKKVFLLEQFSMAKMEMLSSKINSQFQSVTVKMFEKQINGGMAPTCKIQIDGVDYADLNSAGKIQAGLDVISSLAKLYSISVPVWLDNRESVSEIPEVDGQIVNLYVSPEDKELRVEVA